MGTSPLRSAIGDCSGHAKAGLSFPLFFTYTLSRHPNCWFGGCSLQLPPPCLLFPPPPGALHQLYPELSFQAYLDLPLSLTWGSLGETTLCRGVLGSRFPLCSLRSVKCRL